MRPWGRTSYAKRVSKAFKHQRNACRYRSMQIGPGTSARDPKSRCARELPQFSLSRHWHLPMPATRTEPAAARRLVAKDQQLAEVHLGVIFDRIGLFASCPVYP